MRGTPARHHTNFPSNHNPQSRESYSDHPPRSSAGKGESQIEEGCPNYDPRSHYLGGLDQQNRAPIVDAPTLRDMPEIPWPSNMECLSPEMNSTGDGWITFIEPGANNRTSLPVTTGPSREGENFPYWHIEFGDGWVETSPSIHVPGEYHSPGVVRWRVVDKLADE